MKKIRKILIVIIVLILGVIIYRFFDNQSKLNYRCPIEMGKKFAIYLFLGKKEKLLKMPLNELAKTKVENTSFTHTAIENIMTNQNLFIIYCLYSSLPLFENEIIKMVKMEPVMFEKFGSDIVVTFICKNEIDEIIEIPGKGKMLFSVALYYHEDYLPTLILKVTNFSTIGCFTESIFSKVTELPIIGRFIKNILTKKQWVIFDYGYKYTFNDYAEWVIKEAAEFRKKQCEESKKYLEHFLENYEEKNNENVRFYYCMGKYNNKKTN